MSTVTSRSAEVMREALKYMDKDLDAFGEKMMIACKINAPPPPKFGDVPATGNNAASIDYNMGNHEVTVFTESGYGGWLEVGTSKMDARPYFRPSFEEAKQDMGG